MGCAGLSGFAEVFAPHLAAQWRDESTAERSKLEAKRRALVWKQLTVVAGSDVRMQYGGQYFFGKVEDGKIVDADGDFTPSEWASKNANNTSRNAWRDLWFREPGSSVYVPAIHLRLSVGQCNG